MAEAKYYYTVRVEGTAPVTISYRVLAETPEEAVRQVEYNGPGAMLSEPPKPTMARFRKTKARVYKMGTSTIDFIKNY